MHTLCNMLDLQGLPYLVRHLKIADYLFLLSPGGPGAARDRVAPILVERKTMEDVAASINDGRWQAQQQRMLAARRLHARRGAGAYARCRLVYILEGDVKQRVVHGGNVGRANLGVSLERAEREMEALKGKGFEVVKTSSLRDSCKALSALLREVAACYSCSGDAQKGERACVAGLLRYDELVVAIEREETRIDSQGKEGDGAKEADAAASDEEVGCPHGAGGGGAAAPAPPAQALGVGMRIRVVGLHKSPQYNGLLGEITGEGEGGRWQVVLEDDGRALGLASRTFSLKPQNLLSVQTVPTRIHQPLGKGGGGVGWGGGSNANCRCASEGGKQGDRGRVFGSERNGMDSESEEEDEVCDLTLSEEAKGSGRVRDLQVRGLHTLPEVKDLSTLRVDELPSIGSPTEGRLRPGGRRGKKRKRGDMEDVEDEARREAGWQDKGWEDGPYNELMCKSLAELKDLCCLRFEPISGTKADLVRRLALTPKPQVIIQRGLRGQYVPKVSLYPPVSVSVSVSVRACVHACMHAYVCDCEAVPSDKCSTRARSARERKTKTETGNECQCQ